MECLVFPNDKSGDWDFIRQFVDLQDNSEDFSSDYPWYARAERIQKNIEHQIDILGLSEPDYDDIAERMQYSGKKDALEAEEAEKAEKEAALAEVAELRAQLSRLEGVPPPVQAGR